MTHEQKLQIAKLMNEGKGYRAIAAEFDLPVNSVKSWCRRHQTEEEKPDCCPMCVKKVISLPHKQPRRFCSDSCRNKWWSVHPEERTIKVEYMHTCRHCSKKFTNNRKTADCCCRACFANARRKAV